jgi:hypothetical protein
MIVIFDWAAVSQDCRGLASIRQLHLSPHFPRRETALLQAIICD